MLEVTREYFKISAQRMHREIQAMVRQTVELLRSKGIEYADLKNALVPRIDRREMALVFDSTLVEGGNYAVPGHERLLSLLHRDGTRAILSGDYLGENHQQDRLFEWLTENLVQAADLTYRHSVMIYVIYVNNLTAEMIAEIHRGFEGFVGYVGHVDTTYASGFKWWLSTCLPGTYIQHRNIIIGPHEDDRNDAENINLLGFPFEEAGFELRSFPSWMEGVLLSYKIERPVMPGFEVDTEFSLNAVHPNPLPLDEFEIVVDERKFEYLEREKAESLRGLGLLGSNAAGLKALIREKIAASYIYNMAYSDDYDVTQFNIIIEARNAEGRPFRALVGLKYLPELRQLHLITLI